MLLHTKRKCYMNCCRIWKKSSKHCGHTGWIRRHKDCKWKLKINKVLRTTAKMIHELVLHTSKSHQNIVGTQANYESTKYSNEKSKSNKILRTTAKMMHELLPDRKKVMETLRARRMIRLLPERYDLNRPLVLHLCRSWLFSLKSDVLSWKFKWCLIPPTPFFVPPKGCEASVIHLIPENHHWSQKTSLCCSINCHLVLRKQSRLWSNVMDTCRNLGSHLQPCVHIYKTMFSIV